MNSPQSGLRIAIEPTRSAIPRKWRWHYRALERLRDTLVREREEHTQESRVQRERGGTDRVDVATNESEHDTLVAEIRLEEAELAEVLSALDRIRNGTYGICEITGQPIPAARLRAVPWTGLSEQALKHLEARLAR